MSLTSPSIDQSEVDKFSRIADEWWDECGKFKPLHQLNPIRIKYIRDKVIKHFAIEKEAKPLSSMKILDIGCGGGLLTVPLGKLGADILGIDVTEKNIKIANAHKIKNNLADNINFLHTTIEKLEQENEKFDVVITMEVVEHVADLNSFLKSSLNVLKPGGLIFISTLNKTLKSYLLAIIGAEYVLRWLPVGTHDWNKFLAPEDIISRLAENNIKHSDPVGVSYNPLYQAWSISEDISVNYMLYGIKQE
ncbi:3-demethylubiquinone-9 3-methyltransferase [Candidatus Jidaibacter acanthamoeba]|uniref:Ubiquinone biosynthesis O-methyltransferase n=1 Tax=Candidatus Jidaibacter acanthamoebae TaxID=86105 RepID=A0A0C1QH26_9RICK|nr:bifunctional 2-polyprenyl-6-hydroxyphenol methylase/3-demethylubiquinol 3-O-methyltransferase UbiG [Candidatus Jidaibacter acanthamoeba]KIE04864.1 3-demethylubiquinone-9 3-methyltransferase [Candidatus Jidaibacter acanthamoeba]